MESLILLARLFAWLVLLSVIFIPLERLCALHPQRVFRPAVLTDLGYYFIGAIVPGLLLSAPLSLLALGARHAIPAVWHDTVAAAPLWLILPASLLIGECGFYWGHRLTHQIPMLWRFHAIHHSAEQMDFLVNTRAHPVDLVFTRLCGLTPLYILGLAGPGHSMVSVIVILFGTLWGFVIHANINWRLRPIAWLLATPAFHHWHHNRTEAGDISANYAAMFPLLDHIFGTHATPGHWPEHYGITDPMPHALSAQLTAPFRPSSHPTRTPATAAP